MGESMKENDLPEDSFRLCRLCVWQNYDGLGFYLEKASIPPHIIRTVESNSPAAAGGLKILDFILGVNNQDVSTADYKTVTKVIRNARDNNDCIQLLVIEKCFYGEFKRRGYSFNPRLAKRIETPTTMPRDYMNFPKYTPRTCEIHLNRADQSFGFEVINGIKDIGVFIQEIVPNTPASGTTLRKCDRILEINDKFVDNKISKDILKKLYTAKKKCSVKLYVVDTNTFKYFQQNRIPLTSKKFRKSKFGKQQQQQQPETSTYLNIEDISIESRSLDVDIPLSTFQTPTSVYNQQPNTSERVTRSEPNQDDIRLCTINRANAIDPYGIELNFHKREQYHSLNIITDRDDTSSNAALAGVKTNDHLIEINGQNIENIDDDEVKRRIGDIKYPQLLQILVADSTTYYYYKQQNKLIHSGLSSVQKLPRNITDRFSSLKSSHREPTMSIENSQFKRRNYKLYRIQGFSGYGFKVNSNQGDNMSHKITQIAPHSPAAQQGLRVGDYILTINNKNVEKMNASDFNQFLRTSAQNAETYGNPLLLQVINEDLYKSSPLSDHVSTQHNATDPLSTSSYYKPIEPIGLRNGRRKSSGIQPTPSDSSPERVSTKQQQQLNLDSNDNSHRLKTANSPVLVDTTPVQKLIQNQKIHNSSDNKQFDSKRTDVSMEQNRKIYTPLKIENDVVYYSDDSDSDYSDDWKVDSDDKPKPAAIHRTPLSESKMSNNAINIIPSDPTAFEASFCRKRQEVIDNMSYRQAVNSWTAKSLHDVVKLIIDLSKGKSLIDRAWIVFYWVSQNIEYDVEAYFSGNIPHQTPEDIFASGKGVCDAFGTIFEALCNAVQIECKKISGYAKGYSFKMGQKSFDKTNHAWNVIHLEGHWYLVDPTWGEGFLDTNNCNRKKLNPFYFLVRPEQMIYRHLPENPKWQLLMSPISMDDFVRLPYVYPTFFEHNLDIIYPRYSNTVSFNSNLGLAEVLVQAPSDTVLIGDIEQTESGKIKNGCLIQYDANRQQWQCLFAPQQGGFHTLTLYTRREKQVIKSKTDDSTYSCAIQFGLHVPTDIIKGKIFPLTYGLFTERKCQIFEPLDGVLKSDSKVTIHCHIPGAYCARLQLDGNWLSEDLIKDGIFKREITVPKKEVKMYVQFSDKQSSLSYDRLFCYSVK